MSASPNYVGSAGQRPSSLIVALRLAEEWSLPVFPCRRNAEVINGEIYKEKSPHPTGGFYDASTNLEQIEAWWKKWPDALVGVPTGRATNLFVIDVDPRGADWYAENATRLCAARIHKTNRGHHLLFSYPTTPAPMVEPGPGEWRNTGSTWHDGLDTRGEGGYIIWWPAEGNAATGEIDERSPLPDWVQAELASVKIKKASTRKPSDGGIGEDRSKDLLKRVARDVRAGLADYEIHAKHAQHPHVLAQTDKHRAVQRCIDLARSTLGGSAGAAPGKDSQQRIKLRSALEIATSQPRATWLLRPYIERRASILMFGDRGSLKSFLSLDWAMQIASTGEPVVYLSAEGRGLWKRLRAWCLKHAPNVPWKETLAAMPFKALEVPLNLSDAQTLATLQNEIEGGGITPAFVVIDTLSRFSNGKAEATNEDANAYLNQLDQAIRVRYDASYLLVHHTGNTEKQRHRGAASLGDNTDAVFRCERPDPNRLIISVSSGRMKDCEPPLPFEIEGEVITIDAKDDDGKPETSLALRYTGNAPQRPASKVNGKNQRVLLAELERLSAEPGALGTWTMEELRALARGLGMSKGNARAAVLGLQQHGYFQPTIGGSKLRFSSGATG